MSPFAHLSKADFWEGFAVAVAVAVIGALQQGLTEHAFNVAAYDWQYILDLGWKAGAGYLATMFATTRDGKLLGAVRIRH